MGTEEEHGMRTPPLCPETQSWCRSGMEQIRTWAPKSSPMMNNACLAMKVRSQDETSSVEAGFILFTIILRCKLANVNFNLVSHLLSPCLLNVL